MLFIYREKIKGRKVQFINAQDHVSLNFEIQKNNRKLIDSMTERAGIYMCVCVYIAIYYMCAICIIFFIRKMLMF